MDDRFRRRDAGTSRSSVGSLPLKGGGQEGVVAAATPWKQDATTQYGSKALSRDRGSRVKLPASGSPGSDTMRHRPPPVLPLSGGGTRAKDVRVLANSSLNAVTPARPPIVYAI